MLISNVGLLCNFKGLLASALYISVNGSCKIGPRELYLAYGGGVNVYAAEVYRLDIGYEGRFTLLLRDYEVSSLPTIDTLRMPDLFV